MMAEQLAAIAAPALTRNDGALLEQIADESLEHADTRAVRLFDAQHQLLAHAGPKMLNPAPSTPPRQLQVTSNDSASHFQLAVTRRHLTTTRIRRGERTGPRAAEWTVSRHNLLRSYRSLLSACCWCWLG
jgi:two-component system sensor histidine kinase BarA